MTHPQTLVQAVARAYDERGDPCGAAQDLAGLPAGSWPETTQAWRRIDLPVRSQRSYTVHQYVDAVYYLDRADRYRARSRERAMRRAAEIEATVAAG